VLVQRQAILQRDKGQLDDAITTYKDALALSSFREEELESGLVESLHKDLAMIYRAQGNDAEAAAESKLILKALRLPKDEQSSDPDDDVFVDAKAFFSKGVEAFEQDDLRSAEFYVWRTVELNRGLWQSSDPSVVAVARRNVAAGLHQLGWIKFLSGNLAASTHDLKEALALHRQISRSAMSNSRDGLALAKTLGSLGTVVARNGHLAEAVPLLDEARMVLVEELKMPSSRDEAAWEDRQLNFERQDMLMATYRMSIKLANELHQTKRMQSLQNAALLLLGRVEKQEPDNSKIQARYREDGEAIRHPRLKPYGLSKPGEWPPWQ
jgi:tetratricopeptide (TPR) repeat protein